MKVLVVGANGLVGSAAVDSFREGGWDVIGMSRRPSTAERHLSVDLRDAAATRDAATRLKGVTHVVYAAVHEMPGLVAGWRDDRQMAANLEMFRNLLDNLNEVEHVTLLQGAKAYGVHRHPIRIPAREREPRDDHPNFYWLQEDHLRASGLAWTILRPQLIVGPTYGVAMNLPPVIGAYAALCRYLGRPFAFPGGAPYVTEAVDVRLVANAARWAATNKQAWGETYNLTNGEVFAWRDLWPAIADELGMPTAPDEPLRLAKWLPAQATAWDDLVREHNLRRIPLADLLGESHHYADFHFAYGAQHAPPPALMSTVKIKQAGFAQVMDTEESMRHWLRTLIDQRILPYAPGS
ncbi:NAD-dependent epimerase/dehydratase family protein [Micromonospora sp. 4G57]|uniref:NAD-dependent epimerase/dehydratase family protein n=1 Tax=Micromonospora sicca TaxID=2202420 RepID=A0ABU5JM40_9ACTN|nr:MULTISPECIES: NAD-dependent epimerase/dehydratase family protein [unclassified Micromonospora]MDZ5446357.1 NAD-dependent epimerase/dehydratase family protein [Micromonospora sp. 4G57]MDZ5493454.1 NAD-dependent epimerase/dehydratase family protein [Micromonospora sp. 4G53]